jgi:chromosome segregation ATPase
MSESEFVVALRAERARLAPIAEPADLPAALERQRVTREEYKTHIEAKYRVGDSTSTEQDQKLNTAATVANQAVADLVQPQQRAVARLSEIDRLLSAGGIASGARKDLAKANASIAEARARIDQLDEIGATLEGEIAELTQKRTNAVEQQGRAELDARLSGKTMPTPKGLAAIDADLESRRAALSATETAKAEIEGPLARLIEDADGARKRLQYALTHCAELEYYEALPGFLPIVARLIAAGSGLCGYSSIEINCDDETLQAAREALHEEIDAV